MKRAVVVFLAALGGATLLALAVVSAATLALLLPPPLPERIVLELELDEGLVETFHEDPLLLVLERRRLRTRDVVEALERARADDRVAALLVRGRGALPGWGTAEELRDAVLRFREAGKPAFYFTETFGELTPGQLSYHLATAFDEIHVQPSGEVGLAPLLMEVPFLRGALDRLEVEPRFDRRWEFKDAQEIFTQAGFTPEARIAREALLASLEGALLEGIERGRGLSADSARALVDAGPYPAREAWAAGLVDGLLYLDEVRDRIDERIGGSGASVSLPAYLERAGRAWDRGPRVALIYGVGTIHLGRSGYDFLTGGSSFGAASVSRAFRDALEDDRVRAILFRIDSPGGSWAASDQVRREVRRARERGIPVVVSMASVAASGGYVVAMDGDRIVAQPSTVTGSIGVTGGKLVTEDFFASLGIEWDQVRLSEAARFYSMVEDFTPEHWDRFQLFLDRIYGDFVEGVSEGRGMTPAEVEAAARGRVWSGRDAASLGLVDALGGFGTALDEIRELLGEEPDAPLQVALYPAERTLFQLLLEERWRMPGAGAAALAVLRGAAEHVLLERPAPVRLALPWSAPGR